jgi:hypothetical protein
MTSFKTVKYNYENYIVLISPILTYILDSFNSPLILERNQTLSAHLKACF